MAAAGLLIDYIMTVAVSIASGVAAITSAYPSLRPAGTWIGVCVIVVLLGGNLRGVRQAGTLFAAPTYAFIAAIAALVIAGLVHAAGRGFHPAPVPHLTAVEGVSVLLVLRAFSSGSTAMTGIEAISNAVPAFQPVEWRNAELTLSWMVGLLIAMFAGVLVAAKLAGVVPQTSQTMLSQLAHLSYGSGPVYVFIQLATAAVLLLAANTSYNDFPRVLFLMARDSQAPRSFLRIGDRLTFSHGIIALSVVSAIIYVAFSGNTASLLPLYAVGVFLAFTLSQTGMVVHWRRHRDQPHWRRSLVFNATGAALSGIVFVIAGVTKFTAGAWVSIILIALIVWAALGIHRYYGQAKQQLALRPQEAAMPASRLVPAPRPARGRPDDGSKAAGAAGAAGAEAEEDPGQISNLTIVPVEAMDRSTMRALAYAAALGQPVFALHISPTTEEAERFRGYWQVWGDHLPLEVIVSPHRALVAPLVNYIWSLRRLRPDLTLTVTVPEIVSRHWWQKILHDHVAFRLRRALKNLPGIVVTSVPFHLTN
jgi:amino acid transporter